MLRGFVAALMLAGCVHDASAPVSIRERCAGQVLKLSQPVVFSERSKRDDGTGTRYDAAEFAPTKRGPHGVFDTLPAGTRLEIVHCEPFWPDPNGPAEDRSWAFAISQDPAGHTLLFRTLLGRLANGRTDFLDELGQPVGAQLLPSPQLTWNAHRFNEIQNSIRTDREGSPSFDLSKTVPSPGF
jgi:hypothetical protein